MSMIDHQATKELRNVTAFMDRLSSRADGSYSRFVGINILGMTHEQCDELGWGAYDLCKGDHCFHGSMCCNCDMENVGMDDSTRLRCGACLSPGCVGDCYLYEGTG